jgi:hypothetical protein
MQPPADPLGPRRLPPRTRTEVFDLLPVNGDASLASPFRMHDLDTAIMSEGASGAGQRVGNVGINRLCGLDRIE